MTENKNTEESSMEMQTAESPISNAAQPYRSPQHHIDTFWDDPRKENLLRALFAQGLSKAQIQKEMGAPSRNVIIGKLQRIGLRREGRAESGEAATKRIHRPERVKGSSVKAVRVGKTKFKVLDFRRTGPDGFVAALVDSDEYVPRVAPDVPVAQRKTLLELTNESCRWPFGDPAEPVFYFCGDPSADLTGGRPYCACHARLAAPPEGQRR